MEPSRLFLVTGLLALFAADASAMYHPTLGRFLQRDPGPGSIAAPPRVGATPRVPPGQMIRPEPGREYADGMNLYQYVRGNPATRVDPTGLLTYYTCCNDTEQATLAAASAGAKASADALIAQLDTLLTQDPDPYSWITKMRMAKARNYLSCAKKKLDSLGSKCMKTEDGMCRGSNAWVPWIIAWEIYICPGYWESWRGPELRKATLLHEATHTCGALDPVPLLSWEDNAKTYKDWVVNNDTVSIPR